MSAPVLHTQRLVLRPFELTDTYWVLRRRLFHRGERVDTWVGSLLPTEL